MLLPRRRLAEASRTDPAAPRPHPTVSSQPVSNLMKGHRMRVLNRLRPALLLAATVSLAPATFAADTEPAPATPATPAPKAESSGITDRLFLSFMQEAAIVKSQWWEGQLEFDDGSS